MATATGPKTTLPAPNKQGVPIAGSKPPALGNTPPTPPSASNQTAGGFLTSMFPWLADIGMTDQVAQWAIQGYSADEIVASLRQTQQYRTYFDGILNADGTMKMSEADYISTRNQYRALLTQYGRPGYEYDQPQDTAAFFKNDVSPSELQNRLDMYDQVTRSSTDVKAAFYVYAGMDINDNDVYEATVNPDKRATLVRDYQQRTAMGDLDYNTWITRATEFGLSNLASQLQALKDKGVGAVDPILQSLQSLDPNQARDLAHVLVRGDRETDQPLTLPQLTAAFNAALIGGAATQAGLTAPTFERAQQFRQAGIDRAQALQAYQQIATQGGTLSGASQRAHAGALSQSDFEDALLLKAGPGATAVQRAAAYDDSLSKAGGGPRATLDSLGRPVSGGLSAPI